MNIRYITRTAARAGALTAVLAFVLLGPPAAAVASPTVDTTVPMPPGASDAARILGANDAAAPPGPTPVSPKIAPSHKDDDVPIRRGILGYLDF